MVQCKTVVWYDTCSTRNATCSGLQGHPNNVWDIDAASGEITSALPGGLCMTVSAAGHLDLSPCRSDGLTQPVPPSQAWTWPGGSTSAGGPLINGGLCLTASSGPHCRVSLDRQLSTVACTRGVTYDCADDGTMWTAKGCGGLFDCNEVDNIDCMGIGHPFLA